MSDMVKIGFGAPLNKQVLLYWRNSNHIEDGTLHHDDDGNLFHVLFDGERLNDEPTHWAPMPEIED